MTQILTINAINKIKQSYLNYSLSVIIGRAIPDVRDGLKPVHRRSLYAMSELGVVPTSGYKKSARSVGEILGKYHCHGDQAVYGAIVKLVQDFNMRYPLIDGQGNFGSIDGDSPAAMRYSECKLSPISMELLKNLKKDTVDFQPNFDGEEKEPIVLPSYFPNLLCNGTEGIAVGMITSIPSHNLAEVIDGTIYLINNPEAKIKDLMKYIKAPDFPTGGKIINEKDFLNIYSTGHGKATIRCKSHMEKINKRDAIIITEIPYQKNKAKIIEDIALIVKDRKEMKKIKDKATGKIKEKEVEIIAKIPQIQDIVDESDREGMRIVIVLKKDTDAEIVKQLLYKYTDLQTNFKINMLAIANNKPVKLTLKSALQYYIEHIKDVTLREIKFDLKKAEEKKHIQSGFIKVLDNIDKLIDIIRNSATSQLAKENIINEFSLSDIQAEAILNLKLHRLVNLERDNIIKNHEELTNIIEDCNKIINNDNILSKKVIDGLLEIKKKYGDSRRTKLSNINESKLSSKDIKQTLIENYTTTLVLTKDGYFKKTKRFSEEQKVKDGDEVLQIIQGNNKDDILLFSNKGICYKLQTHKLNECTPSALGDYLYNILDLASDEKILYITTINEYKGYMLFVYENGKIAKIDMNSYKTKQNRSQLINAFNLDSKLIRMMYLQENEEKELMLVSNTGKGLIIDVKSISSKQSGKSQGNMCMKSKDDSYVKSCHTLDEIIEMGMVDESIKYYRGNIGRVGNFLKKEDRGI